MASTNCEELLPIAQGVIDLLKSVGYYERSFNIVLAITVKQGKEDVLFEQIKNATAPTRQEKGNIQYEFSRDLKESQVFVLVEKWENGDALLQHFKQSYTKDLLISFGELADNIQSRILGPIDSK